VYRRLIRPGASQKELVLTGRLMTLLIGVASLVVAFWMLGAEGEDKFFRNMVTLFSAAVPPVAIPMLWGLLSKKVTNVSALSGFLVGIALAIVLFMKCPDEVKLFPQQPQGAGAPVAATPPTESPVTSPPTDPAEPDEHLIVLKSENVIFFCTALATIVVMVVAGRIVPSSGAERERVESFLGRLRVPIGEMATDAPPVEPTARDAISPFRVVGVSTLLIGVLMMVILPWAGGGLAFAMDLTIGLALVVFGGLVMVRSPKYNTP